MGWYVLSTTFTLFPILYRYAKANRLIVIPIAPDGKGGLSAIGDVAFALTLIISAGMLLVVSWTIAIGVNTALCLGFAIYSLFLVGLFFLPLLSVHWAMKCAKESELHRLVWLFRHEYAKLPEGKDLAAKPLGSSVDSRNRESVDFLGQLLQLYRRVEAMAVWPFNFSVLWRFFSLIILPILLFIIQLLTENALSEMLTKTFQ